MSVVLLKENRLYSKEIGADFLLTVEYPPIQAGREVLLVKWDMAGEVEFLLPRSTTLHHFRGFGLGLELNVPWSYCWAVADYKDQKLVRDWGKKKHPLGYDLSVAEYISHRVEYYDSEKLPLVAADCLARIEELRKELLFNHNLDRKQFHRVNSILIRAKRNLDRMINRWQAFRNHYLDKVGSSRVDELVASRLMHRTKQLIYVQQRSVYLGLVTIGKCKLLVSASRPADAVTYEGYQAEIGFQCRAPLTGLESGKQPENAIVVKKIRATNQDDVMWMNPAPFGIKTTRAFSSTNTVNVFLADPPSNLYIGDIQKEVNDLGWFEKD